MNTFLERSRMYENRILESKNKNLYLDGYWQCENYFLDIREELLVELSIKSSLSKKTIAIDNLISKSTNAVGLHIRRGDYVTNQETLKIHGICSLEYYYKAISLLEDKLGDCHYFIFSDDTEWAKANLKIKGDMTIVDHNDGLKSYEDLYLMSKCDHNIIANSSFSWWGAWLNVNKSKIVIAPRKWFNSLDLDDSMIKPSSWLEI